jgi:hypothetical protein
MLKKSLSIMFLLLLNLALILPASAMKGKPNFCPALYADGETWGTKATTGLPAPNEHNVHSYDALYIIINGHPDQMPVGEAAPGNPYYNGGRWISQTVEWTIGGDVPLLTSYDDIMTHFFLGDLTITVGSPPGGPPPYFQCPLLPVKMDQCP